MLSKKLGIFLIAILLLLVISMSIFLGFLLKNNNLNSFINFSFITNNYSKKLIESKTFDTISDINVTVDNGDITVEYSKDNSIIVDLYSDNEKSHDISLSNNEININLKTKVNVSMFNKQNRIVIKLPKNYNKKMNIDCSIGDVRIESFENLDLNSKLSTGDLKLKTINNVTADLKTGDIKIYKANNVDVSLKTGDLKIDDVNNLFSTMTTGDIKVNSVNNIDSQQKLGDIEINKVLNSIKVKMTAGDVDIDYANINNNSKIDLKAGDVKIDTLTGAYIDAKTKIGDTNVYNTDRKSNNEIIITVKTGDIKVN